MTALVTGRSAARRRAPVGGRMALVVGMLALAWPVMALIAMASGDLHIPLSQVLESVVGKGTPANDLIVRDWRGARVLCALFVGAALGAAGAAFQSLTRNPLGSPDVIGFTSGAATGALLEILVFGGGAGAVAAGAVGGGLVTALVVTLLAMRHGGSGILLILVGIGLTAMLWGINSYLLVRADLNDAITAQAWLFGSLNGRGWTQLWPVLGAVLMGVPVLAGLGRPLGLLEMGDDFAIGLGVRPSRVRAVVIVVAVLLTAGAVATAGPLLFVALAAPQIARRLTGSSGVGVVAAALLGGLLVALADLASTRAFAPTQLPVGIATGLIGGLYLAGLLIQQWRKGNG
ncbi:iron complex transport system permease protein [Nakamurella panacisegetis]|uniref:Iron complex transport system permease protein n=1 Tax=Nakamurella panacisegetis TaxID=1090615 RepID=A0A1H0R170_9ACTN|nr:iron chelate uptake ABC transporter family permease subunit [Nakamurella panacisegetis]SDP23281.1 iron complex transport system permease protein [Nakamurella panacisegetis]